MGLLFSVLFRRRANDERPTSSHHSKQIITAIATMQIQSRDPLFRSQVSEMVRVRIGRTDLVASSPLASRQHCEYVIEVSESSGIKSTVSRRYNEFFELNRTLSSTARGGPIPELPPKKLLGNLDPGFIEDRRIALESYLQRLLQHGCCSKATHLWVFLDVDDAAYSVIRFVGSLENEMELEQSLNDILGVSDAHLDRLSQRPVIGRLVECIASLSDPPLLTQVCVILSRICRKSPDARKLVVGSRGITALLALLERFPEDVTLSLSVRDLLHSLIALYPPGLLAFLTDEQGLSQIHRIAKAPELRLFHGFLALLLWIAAGELPSLQAALAEPDGLGIETMAAFYESPSASARLLGGLLICLLMRHPKFAPGLAEQATRSVSRLPALLASWACRRRRLCVSLPPPPGPLIGESDKLEGRPNRTTDSRDPSRQTLGNLATRVEPLDFAELQEKIAQSASDTHRAHEFPVDVGTYSGGGWWISSETGSPKAATGSARAPLPLPLLIAAAHEVGGRPRKAANNHEVPSDPNLEEVDYVMLYYALCASPSLSAQTVELLRGPGRRTASISSDNDSTLCAFVLYVVNLLLVGSQHVHGRGFLAPGDFYALNRHLLAPVQPAARNGNAVGRLRSEEGGLRLTTPTRTLQRIIQAQLECDADPATFEAFYGPDGDSGRGGQAKEDLNASLQQQRSDPAADVYLNVHVNASLTSHNLYLLPSLPEHGCREPAELLSPTSLVDSAAALLAEADSNQIARTYAASILLYVPWTPRNAQNGAKAPTMGGVLRNKMEHAVPTPRTLDKTAATPEPSWVAPSTTAQHGPPSVPEDHEHEQRSRGDGDGREESAAAAWDAGAGGLAAAAWDAGAGGLAAAAWDAGAGGLAAARPGAFLVKRALVPLIDLEFPQQLLQQRIAVVHCLLRFCDVSTMSWSKAMKREEGCLSECEATLEEKHISALPVTDVVISEFAGALGEFHMTQAALRQTLEMAQGFLEACKRNAESQGLIKETLTVTASTLDAEVRKTHCSYKQLLELHRSCLDLAVTLQTSRTEADTLLRQLVTCTTALRKSQERLAGAKREAQSTRGRWLALEQQIEEAPQRRQKLADQLTHSEAKLAQAAQRLTEVGQAIGELDKAREAADGTELTINLVQAAEHKLTHLIESEDVPPSSRAPDSISGDRTTNQRPRPFVVGGNKDQLRKELREICRTLPVTVVHKLNLEHHAREGTDARLVRQLLQDEARCLLNVTESSSALAVSNPIGREEESRKARLLLEKQRTLDMEHKHRAADISRLKSEMAALQSQQNLLAKSLEVQADVRKADEAVNARTEEAASLETDTKRAETVLETKKIELRAAEVAFFSSRETLERSLEVAKTEHCAVASRILELETSMKRFLCSHTAAKEDSLYAMLNRLLLRFTMTRESAVRQDLRLRIRNMIGLLKAADVALGQEPEQCDIKQLQLLLHQQQPSS